MSRLVAAPHPFKTEQINLSLPEGMTITEMIDASGIDPILAQHGHVWVGDQHVPRHLWHRVRPKPGATLTMRVVPHGGGGGGKNILRTVLTIAVVVLAAAATWYVGGAGGIGAAPVAAGGWGLSASTAGLAVAPRGEQPGAFDDPYPGGGGPSTVETLADDCEKVYALHGGAIMATGSGRALLLATWAADACKAPTIEDAAEIYPPRRDFAAIAGWSDRRGSIVGYAFVDGERIELQHGRHTMSPYAHPDCAGYAEICEASESARHGHDVERFHRLAAANVNDAYHRAFTRPGYGVGAEILTVRADRHGLTRL